MARRLGERAAAVVEGFIELAGTLFAVELPPPEPDPDLVDGARLTYRIGEDSQQVRRGPAGHSHPAMPHGEFPLQ